MTLFVHLLGCHLCTCLGSQKKDHFVQPKINSNIQLVEKNSRNNIFTKRVYLNEICKRLKRVTGIIQFYSRSTIRPKKNCPKVEFLKSYVSRKKYFILHYIFKKHQKVQNMGAFSTIFLKKHPIWTKLGALPTVIFLLKFWLGSVAEGNTFFFLALCCYVHLLELIKASRSCSTERIHEHALSWYTDSIH